MVVPNTIKNKTNRWLFDFNRQRNALTSRTQSLSFLNKIPASHTSGPMFCEGLIPHVTHVETGGKIPLELVYDKREEN